MLGNYFIFFQGKYCMCGLNYLPGDLKPNPELQGSHSAGVLKWLLLLLTGATAATRVSLWGRDIGILLAETGIISGVRAWHRVQDVMMSAAASPTPLPGPLFPSLCLVPPTSHFFLPPNYLLAYLLANSMAWELADHCCSAEGQCQMAPAWLRHSLLAGRHKCALQHA